MSIKKRARGFAVVARLIFTREHPDAPRRMVTETYTCQGLSESVGYVHEVDKKTGERRKVKGYLPLTEYRCAEAVRVPTPEGFKYKINLIKYVSLNQGLASLRDLREDRGEKFRAKHVEFRSSSQQDLVISTRQLALFTLEQAVDELRWAEEMFAETKGSRDEVPSKVRKDGKKPDCHFSLYEKKKTPPAISSSHKAPRNTP